VRETSTDYAHPFRPLPIRLANSLGRGLGRLIRPSFDPDDLMAAAAKKEGLGDFGDGSFRAPLEVLVDAIEREAHLHPLGARITRERLVGALRNRLRHQAWHRAHPGVREADLPAPVVITGLQRTGTTLLHRLLASDPRLRAMLSWEAMNPAPLKDEPEGSPWRKAEAQRAEKGLAYLAPDFFAVHPVQSDAPEEEIVLLDHSFYSTVPEAILRVPTYSAWLEERDQTPGYQYLKDALSMLGHGGPEERWLLKTPHHLEYIDTLFAVFPGTKVIHTHRDPIETLGSFCSMVAHGRGVFSDAIDPLEIGRDWGRKTGRMVARAMDSRTRLDDASFHDVMYSDLIADPMGEVERIYAFLGMSLPGHVLAKIEETRTRSPQHRHGKHVYSLDAFGLDEPKIDDLFGTYRDRFRP